MPEIAVPHELRQVPTAEYRLKLSPPRSCGLAAAVITQPSLMTCFGYGIVDEGYAAVYPLAMTAKVMLAQIILIMVL